MYKPTQVEEGQLRLRRRGEPVLLQKAFQTRTGPSSCHFRLLLWKPRLSQQGAASAGC